MPFFFSNYNASTNRSAGEASDAYHVPIIKCGIIEDSSSVCTASTVQSHQSQSSSTTSSSSSSTTTYDHTCWPVPPIYTNNNNNNNTTNNTLITGHYRNIFLDYDILPTILGTGNYGSVRECIHHLTNQKFAVKSINKSKVSRLDHVRREIELLLSVKHEHIMKIVDYYEDMDYIHIVSEIYNGGELFDKIVANTTKRGCLSEREARNIIQSLLEAVSYLHENDIVHRDIKPENLLLESSSSSSSKEENEHGGVATSSSSSSPSIKLIDFGLARRHTKNEEPMSHRVGTAYYMGPEVIRGKYDRQSDIWSVGVIAYILLCGYPPFNGACDRDICRATLRGHIPFDPKIWCGLSKASRDFVCRLLCKDPRKRFTAEEALQHPWITGKN